MTTSPAHLRLPQRKLSLKLSKRLMTETSPWLARTMPQLPRSTEVGRLSRRPPYRNDRQHLSLHAFTVGTTFLFEEG